MTPEPTDEVLIIELIGRLFGTLRHEITRLEKRFPGLRNSHYRLLTLIPAGGARLSDLVEPAGMTKQALGQFARYLEERGHVRITPDPADLRARVVRKTKRGLAAEAAARAVIAEVESGWRTQVGERQWKAFRRTLAQLATPPDSAT